MNTLQPLKNVITQARSRFTQMLEVHTAAQGTTVDIYHRYLSMQYHLTKGVQRYFMTAAAHDEMAKFRKLRKFLFEFANEEELHYLVAANDLSQMGLNILPEPFDVQLWHAYFNREVVLRPFVRLGAAAVLENLSAPDNRGLIRELLSAPFLHSKNTKFFVLHMHETLPHGQQILDALAAEQHTARQWAELVEGAAKGAVLYLRALEAALTDTALVRMVDDTGKVTLSSCETERIRAFSMEELA